MSRIVAWIGCLSLAWMAGCVQLDKPSAVAGCAVQGKCVDDGMDASTTGRPPGSATGSGGTMAALAGATGGAFASTGGTMAVAGVPSTGGATGGFAVGGSTEAPMATGGGAFGDAAWTGGALASGGIIASGGAGPGGHDGPSTGGSVKASGGAMSVGGGREVGTGGDSVDGARPATGGSGGGQGGGGSSGLGGTPAGGGAAGSPAAGGVTGGGQATGGGTSATGGTGAANPAITFPGAACSSEAKDASCTGSAVCYKYCGPESQGYKTLTCNGGKYVEGNCTFSPTTDYTCYGVTSIASCGTTAPKAGTSCAIPPCQACGSGSGTGYYDTSGAAKVGYCVCSEGKWSCASTTAWPCPKGTGC